MTRNTGFRAVDLSNAFLFGWSQHHKLSINDFQLLMWVAVRGMRSEPSMAFSWFPATGQQDWSVSMCMEHSTLRSSLFRLRKKGLLVPLSGSSSDSRFRRVKGFGIPDSVVAECRQWYQDRASMDSSLSSFLGKLRADSSSSMSTKLTGEDSPLGPQDNTVCPQDNTVCPQDNTVCPQDNMGDSVTRKFVLHTKEETKEVSEYPTGTRCAEGAATPGEEELAMRSDDGWASPKDSLDDFDVPRDNPKKGSGSVAPSTKVLNLFYELWVHSRTARKNLAYPWSMKTVFQARIKQLISEQGLDLTLEMVRVFFRLVDTGQVVLKSDDLWKDFWFNRAKLEGIARKKSGSSREAVLDQESELERFRQMVKDRRRD